MRQVRVTSVARIAAGVAVLSAALETAALAQTAPAGPPLHLADVLQAATVSDPRMRQLTLLESQSSLRLRNVSAQWKPSVAVESVVTMPVGPVSVSSLPLDEYANSCT